MVRVIIMINLFILAAIPRAALACSICFYGDTDTPANRGLRWGVLTLLAVLLVIMAVFVTFLIRFKKRARLSTGEL
ncbi:MAG: hypothetical protein KC900_02650 [Candidatus Omnitrophica bacterium]|nr:hypothetical protein [Candidatus Omnitrophota bacterium]